jgi:hypothetical protein
MVEMKRCVSCVMVIVAAILVAAASPAFAQQQYPDVSTLEPFSAGANFMSLVGYLRWVVFQQTSQWLSIAEAQRIVQQQGGSAGQ